MYVLIFVFSGGCFWEVLGGFCEQLPYVWGCFLNMFGSLLSSPGSWIVLGMVFRGWTTYTKPGKHLYRPSKTHKTNNIFWTSFTYPGVGYRGGGTGQDGGTNGRGLKKATAWTRPRRNHNTGHWQTTLVARTCWVVATNPHLTTEIIVNTLF